MATGAPPPDLATAETFDKGHGRVEMRSIQVSAEVVPHLDWPGASARTGARPLGDREERAEAIAIVTGRIL